MRIDLTLRGADGHESDVAVLVPAGARWIDVAPLLAAEWDRPALVCRDDGPVPPDTPLGGGGLLTGELLSLGQEPVRPTRFAAGHRLDVVGGPDSGRGIALGRTPLTVGRGQDCDLVLRDPDISRVHAEVAMTAHGPTVRDRGSRNGTWVDGTAAGPDATPVRPGRYVRLGDTFLAVNADAGPPAPTHAAPDGTLVVNRPPRSNARIAGEQVAFPESPARARPQRVQWIAALVPAAAGVALATSMHAPQFLLFALLSPIAMLATSLGDRLHWRRERRRWHARYRRELAASRRRVSQSLAAETRARRARDVDPAAVLRTAQLPGTRLWERPRHGADALTVRVGLGDVPSATTVHDGAEVKPAGTVRAVPVTVDLADGPLGITGPRPVAVAVGRWMLAQLAAQLSPADVEFALVLSSAAEGRWQWARWLPHLAGRVAASVDERRVLVAELNELYERRSSGSHSEGRWPGRWVVVLIDGCATLAGLPGLGGLLADGFRGGITAVCIDDHSAGLPVSCANVARVTGETGSRLRLTPADPGAGPGCDTRVVADQVDAAWADRFARALAPLRDPGASVADSVPGTCLLLDLLGLPDPTADGVLAIWQRGDPQLSTVLGMAVDGPLVIDLVRDGPHALVAGTTGAGKSELLRTLVAGLAATHPPESVVFVLVDYKGGAAFADCARLPHTVGLVTDLDSHLAGRALQSLDRELTRREELFAGSGARDLDEYRTRRPPEPVPRLVIVIDEFAELVTELEDFVSGLVGIARRGRSLGVHLVLATQRPGGVVSPEIRANTALRIALRVTDPAESRDVIDTDDAVTIGRRQAGRAYLRVSGTAPVSLQTARVGVSSARGTDAGLRVVALDGWRRMPATPEPNAGRPSDLQRLVEASCAAAARAGCSPPRRPWLDPLPDRVSTGELGAGLTTGVPLGLLDLPHAQRQQPFLLDLSSGGSILFAGGPGSGRTSALLSLTVSAATELSPDRLQLYVIDCSGDGLGPLQPLPHLGSYVGTDFASTATLVRRLDAEVARRRAERTRRTQQAGTLPPALLCVLDGWEAFAAAADEHDGGQTAEILVALLRAGPSAGLTVAITGDRGSLAVRLSSAVGTKLLLRLTDRADYALAGLADRAVPMSLPPGRAVRASDGAEVQLAHLGADPSTDEQSRAVNRALARWADAPPPRALIRVRALPDRVLLSELPKVRPGITLGVGGDAADPINIDPFAGTGRLLIAGPPRSGRSTVLACALSQVHDPSRQVVVAAPARSPLATMAADYGMHVVAPDGPAPELPDPTVPTLLLIDDSEQFLDTAAGDALTAWTRATASGLAVLAAGSSDALAVCFRGVAAEVRRSRCIVLLHPGPGDSDLAAATLPRRRVAGPPGRGVLVGDPSWGARFADGAMPIQIARP